jgi:hypothetical protein
MVDLLGVVSLVVFFVVKGVFSSVVFFVVDWVFSSVVFFLVDFWQVFSPSVVINHSAIDCTEAFFLGQVLLHRSLRFRFRLFVRVTFASGGARGDQQGPWPPLIQAKTS